MRIQNVLRGSAVVLAAVSLLSVGCARTIPQEVTDVNQALGNAKDACASVYAPDQLSGVQGSVDTMNGLADDKKYKKARKEAEPLLPMVNDVTEAAKASKAEARGDAESAISAAKAKISAAEREGAGQHASSELGTAKSKAADADKAFADPCKYGDASRLALEAGQAADRARQSAIAAKRRIAEEEARRKAEAERLRREEEARRAEAERQAKMFPPSYTVEKGDSLWKISSMETVYKAALYWPVLYDANGEMIDNPDLIYPGQELKITRGLSQDEMDRKLHDMWRSLAESDMGME